MSRETNDSKTSHCTIGPKDTRSDIYSLGVLLYELIVGTTPFDAVQLRNRGYDEICRVIRESEPPTPSRKLSALGKAATKVCQQRQAQPVALRKLVHGDLDWIVMKCLEKERTRRYASALEVAEELRKFLAGKPECSAVGYHNARACWTTPPP